MTAATIANRKIRYLNTLVSPSVYVDLPEVISMSGFGELFDEVEVTNLDSPGNTKEFIAGRSDGVEFDVECNDITGNAVQDAIIALRGQR